MDANGHISNADFLAYKQALIRNITEFYLLNQFRAALLPELRRVIKSPTNGDAGFGHCCQARNH